MTKKFIIAMDSQVPTFTGDGIRMFMFRNEKNFKYDTFEEAEKFLEEILNLGEDKNIYTILPIYTKA